MAGESRPPARHAGLLRLRPVEVWRYRFARRASVEEEKAAGEIIDWRQSTAYLCRLYGTRGPGDVRRRSGPGSRGCRGEGFEKSICRRPVRKSILAEDQEQGFQTQRAGRVSPEQETLRRPSSLCSIFCAARPFSLKFCLVEEPASRFLPAVPRSVCSLPQETVSHYGKWTRLWSTLEAHSLS